ncbi:hypothetical protein GMRT_15248 [Giardia muris]|uniref:FAM13A-like domain-containing protein n=1 Tax=Giardia muris TaxID=5742 RepID=A0A4Z1SQN9_GIAMU|nr:hypothetical protein GMRT_15248 [Giardia muris]|eukprot:TNJ28172.1 hypothetical protein GMRT_15248 [Giardia muris]
MSLPGDFIRTPLFDKLITTLDTCVRSTVAREAPLIMLSIVEPSARTIPSSKPSTEGISAYMNGCLTDMIARVTKKPVSLVFDRITDSLSSSTKLTPKSVFEHPSLLTETERKDLAQDNELIIAWAAGTIYASYLGKKGRERASHLINKEERLPLCTMHLERCRRSVALLRRAQKIQPINIQTGRPINDRRKVISGFNTTPSAQASSANQEENLQLIRTNRAILKQVLRTFNTEFEACFGREPTRDEKEILRPLYVEYKALKGFLPDGEDDDRPGASKEKSTRTSTTTPSESIILEHVQQVKTTVDEAYRLLQSPWPENQTRLKHFKKEVQKCLFELKERYESTHTEVTSYKANFGRYPGDLQSKWSQPCVDTYHLLYNVYDRIKKHLD